ncbi:MAG: hypothetical protein AAFR52_15740 [Pseudomonadota bacterium]
MRFASALTLAGLLALAACAAGPGAGHGPGHGPGPTPELPPCAAPPEPEPVDGGYGGTGNAPACEEEDAPL